MKENTDKQLDALIGKIIKDASLESPSFNFTKNVLHQINNLESNKAIAYKPLISNTVWGFILGGFLVVVIYVIFGTNSQNSGVVSYFDFNKLNFQWNSLLAAPSFSKTSMYAIAFLGLMVCLQIPFLKHYFNQRLED